MAWYFCGSINGPGCFYGYAGIGIGSWLIFIIDLRGAGVAAGIYAAITALISAFVAGFFAVKASAPEAIFGDGTDILPTDATLTGILTAAAIVVISSVFAMSSVSSVVRTTGSAVRHSR